MRMSQSEVIVDEQALSSVSDSITKFSSECRTNIEDAIRKIKLNSTDWNDEDFNRLLSAINSFMADVNGIDEATKTLNERINTKIAAIHELHSMKI